MEKIINFPLCIEEAELSALKQFRADFIAGTKPDVYFPMLYRLSEIGLLRRVSLNRFEQMCRASSDYSA